MVLVLCCTLGTAWYPGRASANTAAPDTTRLAAALDSLRAEKKIRGAAATLVFPDGTTWHGTSGEAWTSAPVTSATLFEIGSITKTFTSALTLSLVAEGRLSLDDPLTTWLPDFPNAKGVTVRHLLQHTSGLHNYSENPDYIPALRADFSKVWKPEDSFAYMKEAYFAPGEGWHYSNANYLLLGLICEKVTGAPFPAELRRRVLEPQNLDRIFFQPDETPRGEVAHAYIDINDDGTGEDVTMLVKMTSFTTAGWSAGALLATSPDLARWMRAYATGEIVRDDLHREMTQWVDRGDGMFYGFGLIRKPDDRFGDLLGHKGNSAGYSASAWHAPQSGVTVAVLTNVHAIDVTPIALALLAIAAGVP